MIECKERIIKLIQLSIYCPFCCMQLLLAHISPLASLPLFRQTEQTPTSRLCIHGSLCFIHHSDIQHPHRLLPFPTNISDSSQELFCPVWKMAPFALLSPNPNLFFFIYKLTSLIMLHIYLLTCLIPVSPNSPVRAGTCLLSSLLYFLCLAEWLAQDRGPINIDLINKWYIWIISMYHLYFLYIEK